MVPTLAQLPLSTLLALARHGAVSPDDYRSVMLELARRLEHSHATIEEMAADIDQLDADRWVA